MNINFSFDTKYGQFSDALVLEDTTTYSDVEIEAMKQERLNNWVHNIENSGESVVQDIVE